MKKFLALAVAVMMLVGMMSFTTSASRNYTYTAAYGTPVVDGKADDACWANAATCAKFYEFCDEWVTGQKLAAQDPENAAACEFPIPQFTIKMVHDDQYLYCLLDVIDYTGVADGDYFEFFIDEDFCQGYRQEFKDLQAQGKLVNAFCPNAYQLRIPMAGMDDFAYNGTMGDNTIDENGNYKEMLKACVMTNPGDNHYIMECCVAPLSAIPTEEGAKWGVEFAYQDNDSDGNFINYFRWNWDCLESDDVVDGYAPGYTDDRYPYEATNAYAPLYFLADANQKAEADETNKGEDTSKGDVNPDAAPAESTDDAEKPAQKTSDAGIVVAAVVMAAAAAVVLGNKKH